MTFIDTVVGRIGIAENGHAVTGVFFAEPSSGPAGGPASSSAGGVQSIVDCPEGRSPLLERAVRELETYFSGVPIVFSVPLELDGTAFQRSVWDALLAVPWGETRTYGDIAETIGKPKASRAVGQAVHRNPAAILVPCHRIVGKDGTLTGYAGGLWRKEKLLALESRM